MAGGSLAPHELDAKITPKVVISCIMAATGGLMFGYDIGVSGHCYVLVSFSFSIFFLSSAMLNIVQEHLIFHICRGCNIYG